MNTVNFIAPLCLALSVSLPAMAGTKDNAERDHTNEGAISTPTTQTPVAGFSKNPIERFIESNVLEALYHEMAHALIDTMNLPVFGPQEHAADFFAAILIDRMHDEQTSRQMVLDVAASYEASYQRNFSLSRRTSFADEHANPMQRYYNLACLYLGADPERRQDIARELELPAARAEFCEFEFDQANFAWGGVLEALGERAPANTITLDWILDNDSHLAQFITREIAVLNKVLALPEPITVSVIPCGKANAYYDPEPKEVIICTELSDHLAELAPNR